MTSNSSGKRILVIIGTRPEAIKLAPLVHALRAEPWAQCRVLVTAQHRQLLDQMLAFFDLRPDRDLDLMQPGQSAAELAASMIKALDPVLGNEQPDFVVAQGDTTTAMVAALCAYYRRIPFGHVEAGLRTGDKWRPFPEEGHRAMVATLADLHFAPTEAARQNLLREGIAAARVHLVGNTVVDALLWTARRVDAARFVPRSGKKLVLVTAHRRENFGAPFARVCAGLVAIARRPDVELLYPVHPNPRVRDPAYAALSGCANIILCEPLDYPDMVAAMMASTLILTDSGGIQEEAPSLGKPVLIMRDHTERPEGVAAGIAQVVGTDAARIATAAGAILDRAVAADTAMVHHNPYGDGNSAGAIVRVLRATLAETA